MVQKSKVRQRVFDIWAGFLFALAIISIWNLVNHKDNPVSHLYGCWFLLSSVIAFVLMRRRKFRQRPASKILSEDKRPPVVYLRSFKDDKITSRAIRQTSWPVFYTEEEYLVDVLHDFGPCIAIGQPGENLPNLGAARMYLEDNTWQDRVRELVISSKLVVLRAGNTQNFLWEVEQSAKNVKPEHIIILIPGVKSIYDEFLLRANRYFPKPLPEHPGDSSLVRRIGSLSGYIYFDEDWTPHFVKFQYRVSFWTTNMVDPPKYAIRNSLAPIYQRFGMAVPEPEGSSRTVLLVSFLISLLGLYALNR
jgi:hypothetical protein